MSSLPLALIALTARGGARAEQLEKNILQQKLRLDERALVPTLWKRRGDGANVSDSAALLRALFGENISMLVFAPAGLIIRCLAPRLNDKHKEPPVLCCNRGHLITLLGAHRGGDKLATMLAPLVNAPLASDNEDDDNAALDDPPMGWHSQNMTRELLARWRHEDPTHKNPTLKAAIEPEWREAFSEAFQPPKMQNHEPSAQADSGFDFYVGIRAQNKKQPTLVPRSLVLGVGMSRNAPANELLGLVESTLKPYQRNALAAIATIDIKADEPALAALERQYQIPTRFFSASQLNAVPVPNPSEHVHKATGTKSVAEASALLLASEASAAAPNPIDNPTELLVPKQSTESVTLAVARARHPLVGFDPKSTARGRLSVVGLGFDNELPTDNFIAIVEADILIGYQGYLAKLEQHHPALTLGKTMRAFALGEEIKRIQSAVAEAAQGKRVALLCSGDGGIYAMGSPLLEYIDNPTLPPMARGIELRFIPNVTAMQDASAKIGALLGHDFCAVSLSDLLTPETQILERLEAAARADFVCALYNPQSQNRRQLLPKAMTMFAAHRPANCPVIVARALGEQTQSIQIHRIDEFNPTPIDMQSLVLIGNSQTRGTKTLSRQWVYTPRGYRSSD